MFSDQSLHQCRTGLGRHSCHEALKGVTLLALWKFTRTVQLGNCARYTDKHHAMNRARETEICVSLKEQEYREKHMTLHKMKTIIKSFPN
jgi:hypothetical protein